MLNSKEIAKFQLGADQKQVVVFHYKKPDGSGRKRTVLLQPPENAHKWFNPDHYVYGIDVEKGTNQVQVWAFDGISDVEW